MEILRFLLSPDFAYIAKSTLLVGAIVVIILERRKHRD
jgi:hypothetical protein